MAVNLLVQPQPKPVVDTNEKTNTTLKIETKTDNPNAGASDAALKNNPAVLALNGVNSYSKDDVPLSTGNKIIPTSATTSGGNIGVQGAVGEYVKHVNTISKNFDETAKAKTTWWGAGSTIDKKDMKEVLTNPKFQGDEYKELREACEFFFNNDEAFNKLATAGDNKAKTISKNDAEIAGKKILSEEAEKAFREKAKKGEPVDGYVKDEHGVFEEKKIELKYIGEDPPEIIDGKIVTNSQWMEKNAADAYLEMRGKAAEDGVALTPNEGFRTNERQDFLHAKTPELAAKPGESNHQSGTAIDIKIGEGGKKSEQKRIEWLKENAAEYGFIPDELGRKPPETWHWTYVGKDTAKQWFKDNKALVDEKLK